MIHVATAPWSHLPFDLLAWGAGTASTVAVYRWRLKGQVQPVAARVDGGYFLFLALGAIPGAWLAGSFNSLREHAPALSHSVAGALVGAIIGVEAYKALRGVKGSTGGVFVASFSLGLVIGRLGCFFAGIADMMTTAIAVMTTPMARRPACPGRWTWATASAAIRCSSTNPPAWRCSWPSTWWAWPAGGTGRCGAAST